MSVTWAWQGAVTDTAITVIAKVTTSSAKLLVADNPGLTGGTYTAVATADATGVVTMTAAGLTADTPYWWAVYDGLALDRDHRGSFRTLPTAGSSASFSIAVGTCAGGNPDYPGSVGLAPNRISNHPVFDTIRLARPLLYANIGDLHYYDAGSGVYVPDASVGTYRDAYDSILQTPRQAQLYRNVPIDYTWDDHDYDQDNSDGTFPSKLNPAQVYRERVPHYPFTPSFSIYHSFQIGRVLFVASDTRYNRSPDTDPDGPSKAMLGPTQITWFDNLLATTTAEALVWLNPTPWMGLSSDTWAGFATERDQLVQMFGDRGWLNRMCCFNGDYHGLALDRGTGNSWGGFPVYVIGSLDSPPGPSSTPTYQYDTGPTSPGNNRWGSLRVVDRGHSIDLIGSCNIGVKPWRVHRQTITTSTAFSTSFPSQPAPLVVEIAPGGDPTDPATWTWVDITSDVRVADGISIGHGRADEWATTGPTTCDLTLDNSSGDYSPRNQNGRWYGQLRQNTPVRIRWDGNGERFVGYVTEWPPRWGQAARDAYVPVKAAGVMRRLAQGAKPLRSALYRSITDKSHDVGPVGYWPFEDDSDSQVVASGLPTGRQLRIMLGPGSDPATPPDPSSKFSFTSNLGPEGTEGGLQLPYGWFADGSVSMVDGNSWTVEWWQDESTSTNQAVLYVHVLTAGGSNDTTPSDYRFSVDPGSVEIVARNDNTGATLYFGGFVRTIGPYPHHVTVTVEQTGTDITFTVWVNGTQQVSTATGSARTVTMPRRVIVESKDNSTTHAEGWISQLAVWPYVLAKLEIDRRAQAGTAWTGELAADRIARLCDEEGIPYYAISGGADTMPMGPQPRGGFLDALREAEAADGGILHETSGGLSYLARADRYNEPVSIALDVDAGHLATPPEPADDDQQLRNDVTAKRSSGSSGRFVDEASVAAEGLYNEEITVNVASDDVLDDIAGWRVHLGTVDEMRWPKISLDLAKNTSLIPSWLDFSQAGGRVTIAQALAQLAGVDVDVLVEGWTEQLNVFDWNVELNAAPASPWVVGILDDNTLGRLDTDGSTLAGAVGAADTSLTVVTVPDGPLWTTDAAELPFDIAIGGETMTVNSISSAFSDAFTRTVSGGWGTADSGQAWSTSGGAASDYSTTSGVGEVAHTDVGVRRFTNVAGSWGDVDLIGQVTAPSIPTGAAIQAGYTVRRTSDNDFYLFGIQFDLDGTCHVDLYKRTAGTFTLLGSGPRVSFSSGFRKWIRARAADTSLAMKMWDNGSPEPAAWTVTATDIDHTAGAIGTHSALLTGNTSTLPQRLHFDNLTLTNPQTFTVTRAVSGIARAYPAGADARLAHPLILGL